MKKPSKRTRSDNAWITFDERPDSTTLEEYVRITRPTPDMNPDFVRWLDGLSSLRR